jgi:hypothetical protein
MSITIILARLLYTRGLISKVRLLLSCSSSCSLHVGGSYNVSEVIRLAYGVSDLRCECFCDPVLSSFMTTLYILSVITSTVSYVSLRFGWTSRSVTFIAAGLRKFTKPHHLSHPHQPSCNLKLSRRIPPLFASVWLSF